MEEVAAQLRKIPQFRSVAGFPADSVTVPGAVVGYPTITYHGTYANGAEEFALPVWVVVGKVAEQAARGKLAPFCKSSGPQSVMATLEAGEYTSLDSLTVQTMEPDTITIGTETYLAARFDTQIIGQGG